MTSSSPEELLGMIKGLADVVKSSHDAQKTQQEEIRALADSMKDLATSTAKTTSAPPGLRLPPVNLPVFKGDPQDKLERFLENFVSIISTSNISPQYYVPYLKQQCQYDIRSFDIITHAEKEHFPKLIADPEKASPSEFKAYFDTIKQVLLQRRGIPKEQQIRELLAEYYRMVQGPEELVSDFAHQFCDVQTELIKLIPGIHMTPKGEDIELQYAFAIKLHKKLQSEIISREFTYNSLQEVIQVAERYEKIHPPTVSGWKPDALISNPSAHSKPSRGNTPPSFAPCQFCRKTNHASQNCFFKQEQKPSRPTGPGAQNLTKMKTPPEQTICQKFNTFVKASCELPNRTCSF